MRTRWRLAAALAVSALAVWGTAHGLARAGALPAAALRLPDGRGVAAREAASVQGAPVVALFVISQDGSSERVTYFASGHDTPVAVLSDGRILFRHADGRSQSMTVEPDGTGVAAYYGPLPAADLHETAAVATSLVDHKQTRGHLLCLNASFTGRPEALPAAARVRFFGPDGVLGESPVAPDGSFFVDVPADEPIRLETLDANGQVLSRMSSTFWVRPNENRGCIGCHEAPDMTPENRRPLAIAAEAVVIGHRPLRASGEVH